MIKKFNSLKYILAISKCSLTIIFIVGIMNLVSFQYLGGSDKLILSILLIALGALVAVHINNDISFRTFTIRSKTENNLIGKKVITIKWYLKLVLLFCGVKDFLYDNRIFSETVIILNVFRENKIYLDKVFIKKNKTTLIIEGLFLILYTVGIGLFTIICINHFIIMALPVGFLLNGDNMEIVHKPLRKLFL